MQVKNICTLTTKQRNDIVFEKHGNATNKKKRNDEAILKHTKVQIVSIYKKKKDAPVKERLIIKSIHMSYCTQQNRNKRFKKNGFTNQGITHTEMHMH